jgi:hypothetical protein
LITTGAVENSWVKNRWLCSVRATVTALALPA